MLQLREGIVVDYFNWNLQSFSERIEGTSRNGSGIYPNVKELIQDEFQVSLFEIDAEETNMSTEEFRIAGIENLKMRKASRGGDFNRFFLGKCILCIMIYCRNFLRV